MEGSLGLPKPRNDAACSAPKTLLGAPHPGVEEDHIAEEGQACGWHLGRDGGGSPGTVLAGLPPHGDRESVHRENDPLGCPGLLPVRNTKAFCSRGQRLDIVSSSCVTFPPFYLKHVA